MTTLAWDGETLAADRCRVSSRGTRQLVRKISDCGDYVFAGCGDLGELSGIVRWLESGAAWEHRPEIGEADSTGGLVVRKRDGALYLLTGHKTLTLVELPPQKTAQGSGAPYALAAMACGKTAAEAVEIASQFDDGTGLGVDAVSVVGGEAAPRDPR